MPSTATQNKPRFFATAADFRRWLERNHAKSTELWVGYYKKGTGRKSVTYQEALDEALCYGWIDGVVRRVDDVSYMQRWTPRTPRSNWSEVNIARAARLEAEGRMTEAGRAAFARRDEKRSRLESAERKRAESFTPAQRRALSANRKAKQFLEAQPDWYRRIVSRYVNEAKKPETREKRLATVIADSARGQWLKGVLTKQPKPAGPLS